MVSVRDLSKRFKLYANPWHRALEWVTLGRVVRHDEFWALRDVSLDVRRGECLGIIGVNGAGKSTLLKILSRTLHPTHGTFEVKGRLVSLLELGTGFHVDLTGRQNLYQSAALLGFPESYIRTRLAEILDFAEIGEFIDQPVRRYSSGMFVRLAFSLFAHLEPDVYIVDEALAVGDVFFQQKCFRRFAELKAAGCTILFVTHDMAAISHLCDRALLLSGGKVVADGDPMSVVHDYFALSGQTFGTFAVQPSPAPVADDEGLAVPPAVWAALTANLPGRQGGAGTGTTEIAGFAVSDVQGRQAWSVPSGGRLRFWYLITANAPCHDLNVGIHFYDRLGILVFAIGTANLGLTLPRLEPGDWVVCVLDVTLAVQPGEYTLLPQTGGLTGGSPEPGLLHDRLEAVAPIVVRPTRRHGRTPFYGLANLEVDVSWTQRHEGAAAFVPPRRPRVSDGEGLAPTTSPSADPEVTTFPTTAADLLATGLFRQPWYYTFELLPGVFTHGAGHVNLGLTRALLARCDVENRLCLDIGTMEAAVPVLLSRRGAAKVVGVDVARFENKIAAVKHYTGADFIYYSGLLHGHTVEFLKSQRHVNFDLVVLSGVLYHCFGPLHTLAMARSLVRTGGLMLIETYAAIDEKYAMFFNAHGMFASDPSTYLLPSVPLLDYLFRYFKLQPIDCAYWGRVQIGEHQCARVATMCRAVDEVVAEPADAWIHDASGIVDYLTLCDWSLIENREHDPVGYDVERRTARMRPDFEACDLLATVLSEPPMDLTAEHAIIRLDDLV